MSIDTHNRDMAKTCNTKGIEGFHQYYQNIYGDGWEGLRKSLEQPKDHREIPGTLEPYHIDEASLYPPQVLGPKVGESVLDMCAAPGGKSLQLAIMLNGTGLLVLNELSATRRNRLHKVINEKLDEPMRQNIRIWGSDASLMGMHCSIPFDKILLDAPCSSERHLIEHPKEFDQWSPKRSKNLAHRQMAMLCSALEMLKPGGRLLYSTCSISPLENELNVEKFLKKRRGRVLHVHLDLMPDEAELKTFGALIRPDLHHGKGPMYFALLEKTAS